MGRLAALWVRPGAFDKPHYVANDRTLCRILFFLPSVGRLMTWRIHSRGGNP